MTYCNRVHRSNLRSQDRRYMSKLLECRRRTFHTETGRQHILRSPNTLTHVRHRRGYFLQQNNVTLNRKKFCEIVFVRHRCNRRMEVHPHVVESFVSVQLITVLGLTLSDDFSVIKRIILASCVR